MKKIIVLTLTLLTIITLLCSCNLTTSTDNAERDAEISMLKAQIEELKNNTNKDVETVVIEVEKTIPVEVTVPVEVEVTVPVEITTPAVPTAETAPITNEKEKKVFLGDLTVFVPNTPITLNEIGIFSETIMTSCKVTNIEVTHSFGSWSSYLKLTLNIEKTYDTSGNTNMSMCDFKYKITDTTTGIVAKSGTVFTDSIMVGDKVIETLTLYDILPNHTYRVEFFDD